MLEIAKTNVGNVIYTLEMYDQEYLKKICDERPKIQT